MSEHTKEPWHLSQDGQHVLSRTGEMSFAHVAEVFHDVEDARRIVACVNAFAGISTENIEENKPLAEVLRWLNERIRMAEQQRDKLLAALKECLPYISEDREYNNAVAVIAEVKGQL